MFQQSLIGFEVLKKEFQSTCDEFYYDFVNVMLQVCQYENFDLGRPLFIADFNSL